MRADRIWLGETCSALQTVPISCICQRSRRQLHLYKPSLSRLAAASAQQRDHRHTAAEHNFGARSWRTCAKRRDDSDSDEEDAPKLKNISKQLNLPATPGGSVSVDSSADEGVEESVEEEDEDDIEDLEDEGGDDEDDVDSAQDAIRKKLESDDEEEDAVEEDPEVVAAVDAEEPDVEEEDDPDDIFAGEEEEVEDPEDASPAMGTSLDVDEMEHLEEGRRTQKRQVISAEDLPEAEGEGAPAVESYPELPKRRLVLAEAAAARGWDLQHAGEGAEVTGICIDPSKLRPGDLYIHVSNVKLREAMHQVHPGYVEALHNSMVTDYMGQVQKADAALLVKDHPPRNIEEGDDDAEGEAGEEETDSVVFKVHPEASAPEEDDEGPSSEGDAEQANEGPSPEGGAESAVAEDADDAAAAEGADDAAAAEGAELSDQGGVQEIIDPAEDEWVEADDQQLQLARNLDWNIDMAADFSTCEEAVEAGAAAVMLPFPLGDELDLGVPVVIAEDVWEATHEAACDLYDDPSTRMFTVGITGHIGGSKVGLSLQVGGRGLQATTAFDGMLDITGSCHQAGSRGKTTTAWLLRGIFEEAGLLTGLTGSIEHSISNDRMTDEGDLWTPDEPDPTTELYCSEAFHLCPHRGRYPQGGRQRSTTPDMLSMQALLAGMADRGAQAAIIEASEEGLHCGRLDYVDTDVAIFTGFDEEAPVTGLPEGDDCFPAIGAMFQRMTNPAQQRAVINLDDPRAEEIRQFASKVPIVTYSTIARTADVYARNMKFTPWESEVEIITPIGALRVYSAVIGRHNIPYMLAAVATALCTSIPGTQITLAHIIRGLEAVEAIPGRCEIIDEGQEFGVVVDSASDPRALSTLLDSCRQCISDTRTSRVFLVLGCEGEAETAWQRPYMGEIAHYKADFVILTNASPRDEEPDDIIQDMVAGFPDYILQANAATPFPPGFLQDPGRVDPTEAMFLLEECYEYRRYVVEDRWTAIRWAIGTARDRDIVVIAGRGHQDHHDYVINGELLRGWFDDRVEARNALSKLKGLRESMVDMDYHDLPWIEKDEREMRLFNPKAEAMRR